MGMQLTLADGQLAASSGTILGAGSEDRTVFVNLFNTSTSSPQTVYLTVSRGGGTARTIARAYLEAEEALEINGLPLGPADVLAGYSTTASLVNYFVTQGSPPFQVRARGSNGAEKSSGMIGEIRDMMLKI